MAVVGHNRAGAAGHTPEAAVGHTPEAAAGHTPEAAAGHTPEGAAGYTPEVVVGRAGDSHSSVQSLNGSVPAHRRSPRERTRPAVGCQGSRRPASSNGLITTAS